MKDVREILTEKETALQQLRKEIDSLRMVASLLNDDGEESAPVDASSTGAQAQVDGLDARSTPEQTPQSEPGPKPPQSAGTDQLFSSVEKADTGFWRLGKRRKHG